MEFYIIFLWDFSEGVNMVVEGQAEGKLQRLRQS